MKKYVIKLAAGQGYLCHAAPNNNRVVIYDSLKDTNILMDVQTSGGTITLNEGDVMHDVHMTGWYDNTLEEIEDPVESLFDYKLDHNEERDSKQEQTVYLP
jgi:hypothetical protein